MFLPNSIEPLSISFANAEKLTQSTDVKIIIAERNKLITFETSSNTFFNVFVCSSMVFIASPVTTAKNTIARTFPFVVKALTKLFGIIDTIIFNGLDPVVPC